MRFGPTFLIAKHFYQNAYRSGVAIRGATKYSPIYLEQTRKAGWGSIWEKAMGHIKHKSLNLNRSNSLTNYQALEAAVKPGVEIEEIGGVLQAFVA
jgi:hypothetical protein